MNGDEFGYDPTMMGEWNELHEARPVGLTAAQLAERDARVAKRAAEQAAFVAASREEARARVLQQWHEEHSCGRCGEIGCRGECVL